MSDVTKEYFLFGKTAVEYYYDLRWDEFIELYKKKIGLWDFQLYDFDWAIESGFDLLCNYKPYNGFARLTKAKYQELDKIRQGKAIRHG